MKLTIQRIIPKTVNTVNGPKGMMTIVFKERPGIYIDSWAGDWNKDFKEGQEIECVMETEKQASPNLPYLKISDWTKGDKSGKNYQLYAPATSRFQGVGRDELDALVARVTALEEELLKDKEIEVPGLGTEDFEEGTPVGDVNAELQRIEPEDIPF